MKKMLSLMLAASLFCFASCKEGDETPEIKVPASLEMKVGESYDLKVTGEWVSTNESVATVTTAGVISAKVQGEANIHNNSDLSCNVTVIPSYTLYEEPLMDWGITVDNLKSKKGTPDAEEEDEEEVMLTYMVESNVIFSEMYLFGKDVLTASAVILNSEFTEEMAAHLVQRYLTVSADSETYTMIFVDTKEETMVYAQLYADEEESDPYWIVSYMPLLEEDLARSAADCKKISDKFAKQYRALR